MVSAARRGLPRLAAAVLRAAIPADWREDVVRDVEEAYTARVASGSRRRSSSGRQHEAGVAPRSTRSVSLRRQLEARVWLWVQVLLFWVRFLPTRLADLASLRWVTMLDVRLAFRSVRRSWALSVLTVVAMAFGIGATAGAFGLIAGAFFSELPFPGGDRIHLVEDYNETRSTALWVRGDEFVRRKSVLTSFEWLGAFHSRGIVMGSERRVMARYVTPDVLRMTETAPLMGRLPDESDAVAGAEPVVVLPYDLWASALGSDPGVIGSRVELAGVSRTVIGVMPPGFGFPYGDELWIPIDPRDETEPLRMVGKLREGVDVEAARAELAVVARQDPRDVQSADDEITTLVTKLTRPVTGDSQLIFLAAPLFALILLLVVMATNVATVVLARNAARSGELAVRVALGASRRRVVGQLVLEVGLTVAVAAALGLGMARWGLAMFDGAFALPFWVDFSLDPVVVGFTVVLAALATAVAGLAPALRTTSGSLQDRLKDGGRGGSAVRFGRTTDAIVVVELGISVGFLAAAAILGQSLLSFGFARYGLPGAETLVSQVYFGQPESIRGADGPVSPEIREAAWAGFLEEATLRRAEILGRILELPGVRMAAVSSRFPGDESETTLIQIEEGRFDGPRRVEAAAIGAGYFELLGAAPLQGRDFTAAEHAADGAVTIVDEPFVRANLGGGNAVGRRIRVAAAAAEPAGPWLEIVGVVPDLGLAVGDPSRGGTVYTPIGRTNILWVGIRGEGDPNRWTPGVIELVREVDEDVQVQGTQTLERLMSLPVTLYRGLGVGFLVLGAIALLLSAASLHAVTAAAVTRRTREMGIRRALGAPAGALVRSTVRRAAVQVAAGCLLGGLIGFGLLQLAAIFPWRLGAGNPVVIGLVPAVLALAVLLALAGPLARTLSIRPADALRHE